MYKISVQSLFTLLITKLYLKDQQMGSSVKLPNPLPPGMPLPPISSTSVVEPTDQIYTCPLCHENQSSQKDFTTHIRGHNEVKPHSDPNDPTGKKLTLEIRPFFYF